MKKNILNISLDNFKNNKLIYKSWVEEINDEICIWKENEKNFFAYSNICPHNGGEFSLPKNNKVKCKWHGWEFSLFDGKCATFKKLNCKIKIYECEINNNTLIVNTK
jgi:nitrite reductase/ring-hydroxylating ferredoxin subunit